MKRRSPGAEDVYRLSPMQELMLLHALSDRSSPALCTQFCFEIEGCLDVAAFRRAWEGLVDRHPALRTAFLWRDLPHPVQAVRRHVRLPFEFLDLQLLPDDARQQRLEHVERADRERGFDLGKPPLMRVTLVRMRENVYLMIWSSHHLVIDRWCLDPLFDDLATLYEAELTHTAGPQRPPAVFRDYIAWIQRQDETVTESYWRAALRGFRQPSLAVRTSAPTGRRPASMTRAIPLEVEQALRESARLHRVTIASTLLGAIALWLAGRTDRTDIAFGVTASGRPADLPASETAVGSFVTNVPLRLRLHKDDTLLNLLRALQASQARRNRHEFASSVQILEWSELPGAVPLYDVLAVINPAPPRDRQWPRFEMRARSATLETAYPVTIAAGDGGGALFLRLVYDRSCLDVAEATAACDEIVRILGLIGRRLDARVGEVVSLRDPAPTAPASRPGEAAAESIVGGSTADILGHIWRDVLGRDVVGLDEDLLALGATSLQIARAFSRIEQRLGRALPLSILFRAGSIRALLAALDDPSERLSSLVAIQPHGRRPPVIAIPGVGGNVVGLARLARVLGGSQPFYGLQSRGLDGRDHPRTRIQDVADDFLAELSETTNDAFVLLGICWGAAVALELAHRLTARGKPPALLALMDPAIVDAPAARLPTGRGIAAFVARRLHLYWRQFSEARGAHRRRLVFEKAGLALRLMRRRAPTDYLALHRFRVSRANRLAALRYQPTPFQGHACLFFSANRPVEQGAEARQAWVRLLQPAPAVRIVPGVNSGDALSASNVDAFAAALGRELDAIAEHVGVGAVPHDSRTKPAALTE